MSAVGWLLRWRVLPEAVGLRGMFWSKRNSSHRKILWLTITRSFIRLFVTAKYRGSGKLVVQTKHPLIRFVIPDTQTDRLT